MGSARSDGGMSGLTGVCPAWSAAAGFADGRIREHPKVQRSCIPKDEPSYGEEDHENDQGDQGYRNEEVAEHEVDRASSVKGGGTERCVGRVLGTGKSVHGLIIGLGGSEARSGIDAAFPRTTKGGDVKRWRCDRAEFVVIHVRTGRNPQGERGGMLLGWSHESFKHVRRRQRLGSDTKSFGQTNNRTQEVLCIVCHQVPSRWLNPGFWPTT